MAPASWLVWGISLGLLLLTLAWELWRSRQPRDATATRWLFIALVLLAVAVVWVVQLDRPQAMGPGDRPIPWATLGWLYLAMLCGMVAQYFFFLPEDAAFRWRAFIKPFLASPVVFIPLTSANPDAVKPLASFTLADLMLLFTAFQNGFFWQLIFDKVAAGQKKGKAK